MSPEPSPDRRMGEAGRVINVFLDPRAAFPDIAARPRFWVPVVLLIIFSVAYLSTFSYYVGWDRVLQQQMESNPQLQNMSADQRARMEETQARMASVMNSVVPASPILIIPVTLLVVAGVFAFVFRVLLATDVTFRQLFAVTSYGFLPDLVMCLASIAVVLLKDPDQVNPENLLAFNIGAYLDPESTSKALLSIATSIDLFTFWKLGLLAMGIAVAARKLAFSTALAGVSIPWLIWVLLKTGLAALRG